MATGRAASSGGKAPSEAARPRSSGFAAKLDAWLEANRKAYEADGTDLGPRNARQLAKRLNGSGEPCTEVTVGQWRRGESLPGGRYIAHIERLMGAPWTYLDDPATPWPRPWDEKAIADLVRLLPDAVLERLVEEMRREVGRLPRGRGR